MTINTQAPDPELLGRRNDIDQLHGGARRVLARHGARLRGPQGLASRTRRGVLETAVNTYTGNSGQTITLVGMVHIAESEFYAECEQIVTRAEKAGAVVHYEAICDRGEPRSSIEADLVDRFKGGTAYARIADLLGGLALQHKTDLLIQPHWVNTDVSTVELIRLLPNAEEFVATLEKVEASVDDITPEMLRLLDWALRHLSLLGPVITLHSLLSPRRRTRSSERKVIIGHRNRIAAEAILTESRDVIALWGAGHLEGIGNILEQSGYRKTHTRWLPAIRPGRLKEADLLSSSGTPDTPDGPEGSHVPAHGSQEA